MSAVAAEKELAVQEFAQPAASQLPIPALTANVFVALVSFGFLAEGHEVAQPSDGSEVRLGPLRYAHFEVEVNA